MNEVVLPIAIVGVMPYVLTGLSKAGGFTTRDNERTRVWQGELSGWRQRAYWAHQNAFEALPLFAAVAILAHLARPGSQVTVAAAWLFVLLRVAYAACYLAGAGRIRSTVWLASQAAVATLLLVALSVVG